MVKSHKTAKSLVNGFNKARITLNREVLELDKLTLVV